MSLMDEIRSRYKLFAKLEPDLENFYQLSNISNIVTGNHSTAFTWILPILLI